MRWDFRVPATLAPSPAAIGSAALEGGLSEAVTTATGVNGCINNELVMHFDVAADLVSVGLQCPDFDRLRPQLILLGLCRGAGVDQVVDLGRWSRGAAVALVRAVKAAADAVSSQEGAWSASEESPPVRWQARAAKYDCDELLVVFSSIRKKSEWLDFDGPNGSSLRTNRSHLLFIIDDFGPSFSYYSWRLGVQDLDGLVAEFISAYAAAHQIPLDRVTLAGASKGGSAAILVGTKLKSVAIVALTPQMLIGSYLASRSDRIFEQMIGDRTDVNIDGLNQAVPRALAADVDKGRPIYILTGPGDANCFDVVTTDRANPLREHVRSEILVATSERAIDHASTLHYALPWFLSLLGVMSAGLRPRF